MVMSLFRKLVLIWMMAWLPASGAIAAVMPISGMAGGTVRIQMSAPSATDEAVENSALLSSLPCHGADSSSDSVKTGTCTHCVLCHLAISLMLPFIPDLQQLAPSHNFAATPLLSHASFFPEPTSPPPRSLAG